MLVVTMTFLVSSANSLECVSMNNQECKVREEIISVNELVFYPFNIKVNKCSESCNNINNPYARSCVSCVSHEFKSIQFNVME